MAVPANRNQPIDRLFTNISCIPKVMHFSSLIPTLHTSPIISFHDHISFSLPGIRLQISITVVVFSFSLLSFKEVLFEKINNGRIANNNEDNHKHSNEILLERIQFTQLFLVSKGTAIK